MALFLSLLNPPANMSFSAQAGSKNGRTATLGIPAIRVSSRKYQGLSQKRYHNERHNSFLSALMPCSIVHPITANCYTTNSNSAQQLLITHKQSLCHGQRSGLPLVMSLDQSSMEYLTALSCGTSRGTQGGTIVILWIHWLPTSNFPQPHHLTLLFPSCAVISYASIGS